MYILLFIVVLLVVLFVMKTNNKVETFKNIFKHPFRQVRRVNFENNKNNSNNSNNSNKQHNNETNLCKNKKPNFRNYDFAYRSKYDSTGCIPCLNPPKYSQHNYKCINELTNYNIQDNCVEDGKCRINEDVINMFPVNTCINKNKNNN
tara:strand:+ start:4649 stop:5092 length:444 start_codon:yes stop_codon:yes gene_type:complete